MYLSFHIPDPKFKINAVDLAGLGFFAKMVKVIKSRPSLTLTEDWIVTLPDGLKLIVPAGFTTDLASVPRIFWAIPGFSPFGPLLFGSILHDFGYQYGYLLSPFRPALAYPPKSRKFRREHLVFGANIPVYMNYTQEFFDSLLEDITKVKTKADFIAGTARFVLGKFGHVAWNNYRQHGPSHYNKNSLGLPGLTAEGISF